MRRVSLVLIAGVLFLTLSAGTALAANIQCPTARQGVCDGTTGPDAMNGTFNGRDIMSGFSGGDWMNGYGGSDVMFGGAGDDLIFGGAGNDVIYADGDLAANRVICGLGFDRVTIDPGDAVSLDCENVRRT